MSEQTALPLDPIPRQERWTTVEWAGTGGTATVCTSNASLIRWLEAQAAARPGEARELAERGGPTGERWFEVPRRWLRIRVPASARRAAAPEPGPDPDGGPALAEREVGVAWTDADQDAVLYTTDPAWVRRLCRAGLSPSRPWGAPEGPGWEFTFPKRWVRIRPPRALSEAQRAALLAGRGARPAGAQRGAV